MSASFRRHWMWIGLLLLCGLGIGYWTSGSASPEYEELDESLPDPSGKPRVVFGHTRSADVPSKKTSGDDDL